MQWDSGYDESVEVNQRALIDKVLARYSGEFTGVFRIFSVEADNLNTSVQYFVNYFRTPMTLAPRRLRFDLKPRNTLIEKTQAKISTIRPKPHPCRTKAFLTSKLL